MTNKTITISMEEYERLQQYKKELEALESWGVDNWPGYEEAMQDLYREEELEEINNL